MAFDAAAYLAANPDVAASVAAGAFGGDPYQHYLQYGQAEGRSPTGTPAEVYQQKPGAGTAAQPNWSSGAGYASNVTAPVGTGAYYGQINDAWAAYRAGAGVNPITGKTAAEEKDTWWSTGQASLMAPDITMNYILNAGAKGVRPEDYATAHADMSLATGDSGRGGILPTGQTQFERMLGTQGGTYYNVFGQGDRYAGNNPALLDPRRGVTASPESAARYQQVFGSNMSNTGPFAGLDPAARQALGPAMTAAFNNMSANGAAPTNTIRPATPITSGMFGGGTGGSTGGASGPGGIADFNRPGGTYNPNLAGAGGTSSNYNDQLRNYYNAYFGNESAPNTTMLDNWYGGGYSPTPTGFSSAAPGASAAKSIINSLQWDSPANTERSMKKLDEYRRLYGLSTKDLATAMGVSEAQLIAQFGQYGITLPVVSTTPTQTNPNLDRPNDGG